MINFISNSVTTSTVQYAATLMVRKLQMLLEYSTVSYSVKPHKLVCYAIGDILLAWF